MQGFKINPNKDYVFKIIEGVLRKDGHCPCRVNQDDTTFCPCDEFLKDGICKCNLFQRIEETNKK